MGEKLKKPYKTKKSGNKNLNTDAKILLLILPSGDHYNDSRLRMTRSLSYALIAEGLPAVLVKFIDKKNSLTN